jgi:hypothetical protein
VLLGFPQLASAKTQKQEWFFADQKKNMYILLVDIKTNETCSLSEENGNVYGGYSFYANNSFEYYENNVRKIYNYHISRPHIELQPDSSKIFSKKCFPYLKDFPNKELSNRFRELAK